MSVAEPIHHGARPGWLAICTKTLSVTADDTDGHLLDQPCRLVRCTGAGNLVFTLWEDDSLDAALKHTRAMTVGQEISNLAIRKVWSTGTTGTYEFYG